jgi:alanine-glyoxylate transaminase / serine-glyoxylate transaminase / serine-pyruvate transaminase
MTFHGGRHFLQLPGPTAIPDRILRAMDRPIIDHRSAEFGALVLGVLPDLQELCGCSGPVILYPSSGTGAWEAALTNVLSPGDHVLVAGSGHFANLWSDVAAKLGLAVEALPGDWRRGPDPGAVRDRLSRDHDGEIRAVMVVHNETSTGVTARVAEIRAAIDAAGHDALFLVDTVSSLGSMIYKHDAWGVDVMVCGSQKGLMLPPGLGINALSAKALAAHARSTFRRSYFDWSAIIAANGAGFYPYTIPTLMLFGLREALQMLLREEGLPAVFARHERLARATRAAVPAWGCEVFALDAREQSSSVTAILVPEANADQVRGWIRDELDMSLGGGFGPSRERLFRIGHLGSINELTLLGALCGVQLGLERFDGGAAAGIIAAMRELRSLA